MKFESSRIGNDRGATLAETALVTAILVVALVAVVAFLTRATDSRIDEGRSLYGTYDLPSPR